jgi:hypothetical protein
MIALEIPKGLDAAPGHLDVQVICPLRAHGGEGEPGARFGVSRSCLDQHHAVATGGQVVGAAGTHDAGADDEHVDGHPVRVGRSHRTSPFASSTADDIGVVGRANVTRGVTYVKG